MADGANFADFPSWELLDFSKDCSVWGDWLGIVLTPDPAKPTDLIGPGYWSSINLFISSLPPNGTAYMGNRTFSEVYGRINEWYSYNMYYEWNGKADFSEGYYTMNPEFQTKVLVDPIETCQVEYCNAMAYVGNADLTGIGVSLPQSPIRLPKITNAARPLGLDFVPYRSPTRQRLPLRLHRMAYTTIPQRAEGATRSC